MNRRLYRCQHDRRIAGVAAGLAEYFDIDPTVVRVLWVLSFFVGGVGLLLYIAMAIIVPLEPEHGPMTTGYGPTSGIPGPGDAPGAGPGTETGPDGAPVPSAGSWHAAAMTHQHRGSRGTGKATTIFGLALIMIGAVALLNAVIPDWHVSRYLWPAFILGIGAILVATSVHREPTGS